MEHLEVVRESGLKLDFNDVINRAFVTCKYGEIYSDMMSYLKKQLAIAAIARHGSQTKAAAALGVNRGTFRKWLK